MNILTRIQGHLNQFVLEQRDKKTNRHIVVFESDDWGSIRVSSRHAWEQLLAKGYVVDKRPYERFDILECNEDVERLMSILLAHTDSRGNHPIITLNYLTCNPDFLKISKSGYKTYFSESVHETYGKREECDRVLALVKHGIKHGVFMPQLHGREHYNICEWLSALQSADNDVLEALNYGMCGIFPKDNPSKGNQYMVALRYSNELQKQFVLEAVKQGCVLFEEQWGFKSQTFVAPCYTWSEEIENVLYRNGIRLMQTSRKQRCSYSTALRNHYFGEISNCGLKYSIRNCSFEPATTQPNIDIVERTLNQIRKAFSKKQIAVISTHRINFVGGIDRNNRERNLELLNTLIIRLLSEYSNIEFLPSNELLHIL